MQVECLNIAAILHRSNVTLSSDIISTRGNYISMRLSLKLQASIRYDFFLVSLTGVGSSRDLLWLVAMGLILAGFNWRSTDLQGLFGHLDLVFLWK